MANQSAKKLKQSNEQFLRSILIAIAIVNVLYLLCSLPSIIWWDSFTSLNWAGWILALGSCFGCYFLLLINAKCVYDGQKLVTAGEDLRAGGLLGYVFDIFCVICMVQLLSCIHNYAWFLLFIVS